MVAWFWSRSAGVRSSRASKSFKSVCRRLNAALGGGDVPLDIGAFLGGLGGLDPELLHRGRVGGADDHRDEGPHAHRDDGEDPPPAEDVDQEQGAGEEADEDQQVQGRELGLDVGVAGAVDHPPAGVDELVALEEVAGRLEQGERRQQHRQVGLDLRRHLLHGGLEADPAVEVVGHRGDDEDDHDRREQPVGHELHEGQLEDVEADVAFEEGVVGPEGLLVAEEHPRLPLPGRPRPGYEGEEGGHAETDRARPGPDYLVVALDELLFRAHGPEGGGEDVGDGQVGPHDGEEQEGEDHRQADLRPQDALPDPGEADLVEPQVVGVEAGDPPQGDDEEEHGQSDDDEGDPPGGGSPPPAG